MVTLCFVMGRCQQGQGRQGIEGEKTCRLRQRNVICLVFLL